MHLSWGRPTPDHQTPLFIHPSLVSFPSSFAPKPPPPTSPSLHPSPLSSFPPVQIHLPPSCLSIFSPLPSSPPPPRSFPCCLSPPPLPPDAVRLTTLFPFKIKIIKSAAKWVRVCCWRHHATALMFCFSAIVSTPTHQFQTAVSTHTYLYAFMHSHATFHLPPPQPTHKDRFDVLSSTVSGFISCHPTTAFFTVALTHFSSLFPLQTSPSLFSNLKPLSLSLSSLSPASFLLISRLLGNCAPLI